MPRLVPRKLIGKGGWGDVYSALHGNRPVALKVLNDEHKSELDHQRFAREFEAMRSLDHPNLVRALEWGELNGRPYYTMELVEGDDFMEYVAQHPDQLTQLLQQLLEALAAMHRQGFVHRDLKPDNLRVEAGGKLRLFDFGLARRWWDDHLTQSGLVMGTPAYMSPEQVRGGELDGRSDLYSVGVLAYEAITGVTPFQARDLEATLFKIVYQDPAELPATQPVHLRELIHWLLAKDPGDRPQSAEQALSKLLGKLPGCASKRRWNFSWMRRPEWLFATGLLLGLAGGVLF